MAEENRDSGRASWNINGQFSHIIANRLIISHKYLDNGNFYKHFDILRSVFDLITYNLNEEDLKKMDILTNNVLKYQKYFIKYKTNIEEGLDTKFTKEEVLGKIKYIENIRIFKRALLKVLKVCGYLTNTRDRSKIDF